MFLLNNEINRVSVTHTSLCIFGLVCGLMSNSTAMVVSRWSVNLTTLFPGKAQTKPLTSNLCVIDSAEGGECPGSISTQVWDWARIELTTPGSEMGLISHLTAFWISGTQYPQLQGYSSYLS